MSGRQLCAKSVAPKSAKSAKEQRASAGKELSVAKVKTEAETKAWSKELEKAKKLWQGMVKEEAKLKEKVSEYSKKLKSKACPKAVAAKAVVGKKDAEKALEKTRHSLGKAKKAEATAKAKVNIRRRVLQRIGDLNIFSKEADQSAKERLEKDAPKEIVGYEADVAWKKFSTDAVVAVARATILFLNQECQAKLRRAITAYQGTASGTVNMAAAGMTLKEQGKDKKLWKGLITHCEEFVNKDVGKAKDMFHTMKEGFHSKGAPRLGGANQTVRLFHGQCSNENRLMSDKREHRVVGFLSTSLSVEVASGFSGEVSLDYIPKGMLDKFQPKLSKDGKYKARCIAVIDVPALTEIAVFAPSSLTTLYSDELEVILGHGTVLQHVRSVLWREKKDPSGQHSFCMYKFFTVKVDRP